jgi:hypothetical protein
MAFKKIESKSGFAELALLSSMDKNRTLKTLEQMNKVIDARLVQSASRPISNDEIKKLREKKETPEGKLDKNGKPLKFSRDLESDWTAIDDEPHYGLKEHASVDVNNGFILATTMTPASYHDSPYLPYCTIYSLHTEQKQKRSILIKDTLVNPTETS